MSGRVGLREESRAVQQLAWQINRLFVEAGWKPRRVARTQRDGAGLVRGECREATLTDRPHFCFDQGTSC